MFETLILQYLKKLVEGKVRDFTSPKAFHAVKVQGFGSDKVRTPAQISRKFPMPISALVINFDVKSCEFTDSTPPVVRAFYFMRKAFVELTKLFQGRFQGLWVLYLLTRVQCQVGIHTEVYPYAFTCSGYHFFSGIICHDIQPIRSNGIPKDWI